MTPTTAASPATLPTTIPAMVSVERPSELENIKNVEKGRDKMSVINSYPP